MKTLQQIYDEQQSKSDKGGLHSYVPVYEEILKPYRISAKNILEMGVLNGDSIRMWESYFTGTVYGIDHTDQPVGGKYDLRPMIAEGPHNIFIMDIYNQDHLDKYLKDLRFDVIIEDCEHVLSQQFEMYAILKNFLSPGGIYIIEDIQDIDANRVLFESIDPEKKVDIIDRRNVKNRYDDVLITIK